MGREDCGAEWRSHTPKEQRVKHSRMSLAGSLRDSGGQEMRFLSFGIPKWPPLITRCSHIEHPNVWRPHEAHRNYGNCDYEFASCGGCSRPCAAGSTKRQTGSRPKG